MRFVEIETTEQTTVSINVEHIVFVEKSKTGTAIVKTTEPGRVAYNCRASYEDVLEAIRTVGVSG